MSFVLARKILPLSYSLGESFTNTPWTALKYTSQICWYNAGLLFVFWCLYNWLMKQFCLIINTISIVSQAVLCNGVSLCCAALQCIVVFGHDAPFHCCREQWSSLQTMEIVLTSQREPTSKTRLCREIFAYLIIDQSTVAIIVYTCIYIYIIVHYTIVLV